MDAIRFDALVRSLTAGATRRRLARALAGLGATGGLAALLGAGDVGAKKHKKKKKKCKGKRKCGKKCVPLSGCCTDADCANDGETCVGNVCKCPDGQDACGGSCLASCPSKRVRNPNTCDCCRPSDDLSRICDIDPCCSGLECHGISEEQSQCKGRDLGDPCTFDAQCDVGFACVDRVCN